MKKFFMCSVAVVALSMSAQVVVAQNTVAPSENNRAQPENFKKAAPSQESKDGVSSGKSTNSEKEMDKKDPASTKTTDKAEPVKPSTEAKEPTAKTTSTPSSDRSSPSTSTDSKEPAKSGSNPVTKATSTPSSDKAAPAAATDNKEPAKSSANSASKIGASPATTESKPLTTTTAPATASSPSTPAGNPSSTVPAPATNAATQPGSATATSAPNAPPVPPEQATKITDVIARENVKAVDNVNFSVSVGVNIPPAITVHPLPPSIVEVVPQYRGYDYVVVRDEVVILEPRTRKIVTVIHRGGSSGGVTSHRISLAPERRKVIKQTLLKSTQSRPSQAPTVRLTIGAEVPQTYEIQEFPADVIQESPELRDYEYVVEQDNVIVVDRRDRRVIEILD